MGQVKNPGSQDGGRFFKRLALSSGGARRVPVAGAVLLAGLALWGALSLFPHSARSAAVPRIDLKILLIGTSSTEPDYQAWQSELQREGIPFDSLIESSPTASGTGHTSIGVTSCTGTDPCQTLSDTASDGTPEAKYEGVIIASGALAVCGSTTCTSTLSPTDWSALETYEQTYQIRQIDGDICPSGCGYDTENYGTAAAPIWNTYGLTPATTVGSMTGVGAPEGDADPFSLTTDGATDFPYLKGQGAMDPLAYGYVGATPVSTTDFDSLVTAADGSTLVGVYTDPDGVQQMVETYNQNQYMLQDQLLRHGAIEWLTRGVYLGDQRNYLETDIDDNFLADASWSVNGNATTAPHSTDFNDADSLREVPADVVNAASWSKTNNFRMDMLFNGGGSVAVADGDELVGSGDSGSGGTGSSTGSGGTATGTDPLLAQFTATDPSTGKSYANDFGWISHTWDHPNVDEGCATQDYIESEINQNANWATTAVSTTPGNSISGGLGLTSSTSPTATLGTIDPQVIVTGEHSGIANLLPGNPGQVDPPSLDEVTPATTTGKLAAGEYVYAVTDQFNTAAPGKTPVVGTGQSAASISSAVQLTKAGEVTLTWEAVCHAGQYDVYRAPYTGSTVGAWSLIGKVAANTTTDFINPSGNSTTNTAGGGATAKTFVDTGTAGTSTGSSGTPTATSTPGTEGTADESAYEQNPVLDAAFAATTGGGIKYFGADASKPYPNPADAAFATGSPPATQYANGQTFTDAGAQGIPRYPTDIYYNVSTNAQEIDEFETLYDSPTCTPVAGVTTCNPAGTTFTIAQIVANADQEMFDHMMGNDPRPHYFHQTNLMDQTTGTVNGEGDGLYYEAMNPLLAEYNQYFASNAPIVQLTMPQIGALLAEQSSWTANTEVSGYIQGNTVTITNGGTTAAEVPVNGAPTVGSSYGGFVSGWTSVPAGTSTVTTTTSWPLAPTAPGSPTIDNTSTAVACSPTSVTVGVKSTCTATATDTATTGASTPTGAVGFTTTGTGGTFSASSCTLAPSAPTGVATCSVTYAPGHVGTGSETITGSYAGDTIHYNSSGTAKLTITKAPTTLTVATAKTSLFSATFSATLTRTSDKLALSGMTVSFTDGGSKCSATTSSTGVASCSVTGLFFGGTYTATYAGNADYLTSTGTGKA